MIEHDGCVGCKYEHEDEASPYCDKCTQNSTDKYTPASNADRIRGMSDTELAEWICGVYDDDESAGKFINGILIERYDEDIMLEWLQQPSETEGTE